MRTFVAQPQLISLIALIIVAAAGCGEGESVQTSNRPKASPSVKPAKPLEAPGERAPVAAAKDRDAEPANRDVESSTESVNSGTAAHGEANSTADDPAPAADDPMPTVEVTSSAGEIPAEPFQEPNPSVKEDVLAVDVQGLTRLNPEFNVWLDKGRNRVVMYGEIARREGPLEMFACLKGSKEHESVVSVYTQAFIVHAALQALGADPGKPVSFRPAYTPAEGPEVEVTVHWKDAQGKLKQARGQDWVREVKSKKALEHPWVFAGSGFWVNEKTGERHFLAEDGDFICVSNFPSALLDLPIASTDSANALLFEAFTERIPPQDTKLTVVLTPKVDPASKKADAKSADAPTPSSPEK